MKALLPLFTLVVGIFLGGTFFAGSPIKKGSLVTLKSEKLQLENDLHRKLKQLHDVDIQEYLSLKEQKAQFVKANEILGKMMTIFLADLGLRVGSAEIQKIKGLAQKSVEEPETVCGIDEKLNKKSTGEADIFESSSPEVKEKITQMINEMKQADQWKKNEKALDSISTDSEIESFLKDVEIKNVFDVVSTAEVINQKQFKNISGSFEGAVIFDDKSTSAADISLELDAIYKDGKVSGKSKIVMSRDGKKFSNSNSNGDDLKDFKTTGGSQAIIVATGGKSDYLQLYSVRGGTELVGNYYKQESMIKFTKAGTVTLYRR